MRCRGRVFFDEGKGGGRKSESQKWEVGTVAALSTMDHQPSTAPLPQRLNIASLNLGYWGRFFIFGTRIELNETHKTKNT